MLGFETDMQKDNPDFFYTMEIVFLIIFGLEVIIRVVISGPLGFFWKNRDDRLWNWFDLSLVVYAPVEFVLLHVVKHWEQGEGGPALVLRTVRLMRLFRVAWLFRFFRDLLLLVVGLGNAFKLLVWVWLLLMIIIFFFSILMTRVIGQPYGENLESEVDLVISVVYDNV